MKYIHIYVICYELNEKAGNIEYGPRFFDYEFRSQIYTRIL